MKNIKKKKKGEKNMDRKKERERDRDRQIEREERKLNNEMKKSMAKKIRTNSNRKKINGTQN